MGSWFAAERSERGEKNREAANADFAEAKQLLSGTGATIVRHNPVHYAIVTSLWRINVYPGNRRLSWDRGSKQKPPFLKLPEEWGLVDVAKSVRKLLRPDFHENERVQS